MMKVLLVALCLGWAVSAEARAIVDDAGRSVDVPDDVARVLAAGPPASTLIYTLAPEKLIGWVRAPSSQEKPFLAEPFRELPETGRLTGRGNTANIEAVVAMRPDIIVDVGDVDATYASLADRVQAQTGIPYVLLDGRLARTPETYRTLGEILGAAPKADELAAYAEETLETLAGRLAALPADRRPRVYYGRGPDGLETGSAGSINLEVLTAVGATNVAAVAGSGGGLTTVSPEQVLRWNPEVILTQDRRFYESVLSGPLWQDVDAVRNRRVYRAPTLPFGWIDSPPGVNRLIGIRWLTAVFYPETGSGDLANAAQDFYRRFYHVDLAPGQLDALLRDATVPPP